MYYTPRVLAAAGLPMSDAISLNVVSGFISFVGSAGGGVRGISSPDRG